MTLLMTILFFIFLTIKNSGRQFKYCIIVQTLRVSQQKT